MSTYDMVDFDVVEQEEYILIDLPLQSIDNLKI